MDNRKQPPPRQGRAQLTRHDQRVRPSAPEPGSRPYAPPGLASGQYGAGRGERIVDRVPDRRRHQQGPEDDKLRRRDVQGMIDAGYGAGAIRRETAGTQKGRGARQLLAQHLQRAGRPEPSSGSAPRQTPQAPPRPSPTSSSSSGGGGEGGSSSPMGMQPWRPMATGWPPSIYRPSSGSDESGSAGPYTSSTSLWGWSR